MPYPGSVRDLRLPKVVLSSVDKLIGAGGVIQTSSTNLTLYNRGIEMRLIGGSIPHDELIGLDSHVIGSYNSWGVQTFIAWETGQ
ncbi:hypothetical protein E6H31_00685 [Candidatus Bathyarchaeota archaeon]|nr:MAG: hypothetical protein E6H31_00685 [Candidatus Bathyarchaeota archaeon]